MGIGLDSAVVPIHGTDLSLLQTCDYFYPIVDDPFSMGRITCANVTSDLFAMGVSRIDSIQLIIQVSNLMSERERNVVVPLIVDGFLSAAKEIGCRVTTGSVTENPWCTIGGTATAVCTRSEFIVPVEAAPGDVLVLTKALGTQIACTAYPWIDIPEKWEKIKDVVTKKEVEMLLKQATRSMCQLNLTAAGLMLKHNAHACTDVTGFGIIGHCQNLVKFQKRDVNFVIDKLPLFKNACKIAKACNMSRLLKGTSPETSGGLLISMTVRDAIAFCEEFEKLQKSKAWIIGRVQTGNKMAEISDNLQVIDVD